MIVETFIVTADNTDVLAAPSRLNSIPYNGTLIIELQAADNDATNNFLATLQLPDGSTPLEDVHVPKGATDGSWNADDKYMIVFPVPQGGHLTLALDETGTSTCWVRATLSPQTMASVYDDAGANEEFTIKRVRGSDPQAFAQFGAIVGASKLPQPLAVMRGPRSLSGPSAAVGANEWWGVDIPCPAAADIAWVCVAMEYALRTQNAKGLTPAQLSIFGDSAGSITFVPPMMMAENTQIDVSAGTWGTMYTPALRDNPHEPMWVPLDPSDTHGGWNANFTVKSTAGIGTPDTVQVFLNNTVLLGYPRNYWDSGAIYGPFA